MRRHFLIGALLLAVGVPAWAAPVARVVQYRTAKAADGYISSTARGTFDVMFFQPSGSSLPGYVNGDGMAATPEQPGLFDATKPWVIFKHTRPNGTLGCFTATNLVKQSPSDDLAVGGYMLVDQTTTTHTAFVLLSVACAAGEDTTATALWYVPSFSNPPGQFAWTFPFSGGPSDPRGATSLHGINYDAYFTVCGDVSDCMKPVAQSYWRIYDANLTIAR